MLDSSGERYLKLVQFEIVPAISKDSNYLRSISVTDQRIYCFKGNPIDKLNEYDRQIFFLLALSVYGQVSDEFDIQIGTDEQYCIKYNCDRDTIIGYLVEFITSGKCKNLQFGIFYEKE